MAIKEGFVTLDDIMALKCVANVPVEKVRVLMKRVGIRADRCGAPTRGGYGYPRSAMDAITNMWSTRPVHITPEAWASHLESRTDEQLGSMFGRR